MAARMNYMHTRVNVDVSESSNTDNTSQEYASYSYLIVKLDAHPHSISNYALLTSSFCTKRNATFFGQNATHPISSSVSGNEYKCFEKVVQQGKQKVPNKWQKPLTNTSISALLLK